MARCKEGANYHYFTKAQVRDIRQAHKRGEGLKAIAFRLGRKYHQVWYILFANPKMWRGIK